MRYENRSWFTINCENEIKTSLICDLNSTERSSVDKNG